MVTVRNNLRLFAELTGMPKSTQISEIERIAVALHLDDLLDRNAGEMSGGQKRRLHTAIALLNEPPLVLLDEPTTGADVETRSALLEVVTDLADRGSSILYSTHYLQEVETLNATVVIIDRGKVIASGMHDELVASSGGSVVVVSFDGPAPLNLEGFSVSAEGSTRESQSMSLRRSLAIGRHEIRLLMDDPGTLVFLVLMPVMVMFVMKPLFALSLHADGFSSASGAEQAVPGMAVMFSSFTAGLAGFGFFREHGWGTWERLRASSASTLDIMLGKLGPIFVVSLFQLGSLFLFGVVLLGLDISGSILALGLVIIMYAVAMLGFGMAITAISRTSLQLNTYANLGAMMFAMFGGALVPLTVLPDWLQTLARITPSYWAMRGFLGVILDGNGLLAVLPASLYLLLFSGFFAGVAAWKFRFEQSKVFYG